FLYDLDTPLVEKVETVARTIYGADGVDIASEAAGQLRRYEELGYGRLPVVIAKTHLSLSSVPKLLGAPTGGLMPAREVAAAPEGCGRGCRRTARRTRRPPPPPRSSARHARGSPGCC